MILKGLTAMSVALVLAASGPARAQVAPVAPVADPGLLRQQKTDAVEFKHRLFRLLASYDRRRTRQSDIEADLGVTFLPDPAAQHLGVPVSPGKKVAIGFRSMGGQHYIVPMTDIQSGALAADMRDAILYGFEMAEFPSYGDNCLTLDDVRARFPALGWMPEALGADYPGIRGEREGAIVVAFVSQPFAMTAKDEAELATLVQQEARLNRVDRQRLDRLRAKINGCVVILDLF